MCTVDLNVQNCTVQSGCGVHTVLAVQKLPASDRRPGRRAEASTAHLSGSLEPPALDACWASTEPSTVQEGSAPSRECRCARTHLHRFGCVRARPLGRRGAGGGSLLCRDLVRLLLRRRLLCPSQVSEACWIWLVTWVHLGVSAATLRYTSICPWP